MKLIQHLSFKEEVGNAISHGVMSVLCLFLIPIVSVKGYEEGSYIKAIGFEIFLISLFLMFLVSCLYHSMQFDSKHKVIFKILDHCFIYVAIAGSYTPIALCVIEGLQGIIILIIQWTMVLAGILYKSIARKSYPKISLTIYLIMGWIAVLFIPTLLKKANPILMFFIILGGIFYSIGTLFYRKQYEKNYNHLIWHFFINAGAISHMIGILLFV